MLLPSATRNAVLTWGMVLPGDDAVPGCPAADVSYRPTVCAMRCPVLTQRVGVIGLRYARCGSRTDIAYGGAVRYRTGWSRSRCR
eukprot:3758302-Rhodomonas_salina.2